MCRTSKDSGKLNDLKNHFHCLLMMGFFKCQDLDVSVSRL